MAQVRGDRGHRATGTAPASGRGFSRFRAAIGWAVLIARVALGAVLIYAGAVKLAAPVESARAVQAYQILPAGLASGWAYGQPVVEVALGALLVAGLRTRLTAILAGLLLLTFIGAVASVWARGLSIDCGCFSGGGTVAAASTRYPLEILRDAGLAALAAVVAAWAPGRFAADRPLTGSGARTGRWP